jgi:hypothetical protein
MAVAGPAPAQAQATKSPGRGSAGRARIGNQSPLARDRAPWRSAPGALPVRGQAGGRARAVLRWIDGSRGPMKLMLMKRAAAGECPVHALDAAEGGGRRSCHPLDLTPSRRRSRRPSIPIASAERSCRPLPSAAWFRRDECGKAGPPCSAVPQPTWPCTRRGSW